MAVMVRVPESVPDVSVTVASPLLSLPVLPLGALKVPNAMSLRLKLIVLPF